MVHAFLRSVTAYSGGSNYLWLDSFQLEKGSSCTDFTDEDIYSINTMGNPSFEDFTGTLNDGVSDTLRYWTPYAEGTGTNDVRTDEKCIGSYGLRCLQTAAPAAAYYQGIWQSGSLVGAGLAAGDHVSFSLWYKAQVNTAQAKIHVQVIWKDSGNKVVNWQALSHGRRGIPSRLDPTSSGRRDHSDRSN